MSQELMTEAARIPQIDLRDDYLAGGLAAEEPIVPEGGSVRNHMFRSKKLAGLMSIATLAPVGAGVGAAVLASGEGFDGNTATAAEVTPTITQTVSSTNNSFNLSRVFNNRLFIGQDDKVKTVNAHSPACHWTKGGFTNSMELANGQIEPFWDPVPAELCPNTNPRTNKQWPEIKISGGTTGRDCGNFATEKRVPHEVPASEVLILSSFKKVFNINETLKGTIFGPCGSISGTFKYSERFNLVSFLKEKGSSQVHTSSVLKERFTEKIKGEIHCSTTSSTTTTPGNTVTTVTTVPTTTTETQPTTTETTTTTTPTTPNFAPPSGSVNTIEKVHTNSQVTVEYTASAAPGHEGDQLEVISAVSDANTGSTSPSDVGTFESPTASPDPSFGPNAWRNMWDTPPSRTFTARLGGEVVDLTEKNQGATDAQDSAPLQHVDVGVENPA